MTGRTDFITEALWSDIILIWYCLVDDAYQGLEGQHGAWRQRGPEPVFTDSEVITVALVIDTFFGGHEALGLSFLRQYHADMFPHLPAEGRFNERLGPPGDGWGRLSTKYGAGSHAKKGCYLTKTEFVWSTVRPSL